MTNHTNTFSGTDIQILESGLQWIQEAGGRFSNKLFNVLALERGSIHSFLQLVGPNIFEKNLLQFLNSVLHEIRSHGRVITPFRNQWPSGTGMNLMPLNLWESRRVIEVFLDAFSELAEEAWSPTLEHTWRKALKAILASCLRSAKISNVSRKSELIFVIT